MNPEEIKALSPADRLTVFVNEREDAIRNEEDLENGLTQDSTITQNFQVKWLALYPNCVRRRKGTAESIYAIWDHLEREAK